jgi:hypothetical protein
MVVTMGMVVVVVRPRVVRASVVRMRVVSHGRYAVLSRGSDPSVEVGARAM